MHTGLFAHTCIVMIYFIFLKRKEAELLFEEDGILLIWVKQNFKLHKFSSSINSSGAKIKWEETLNILLHSSNPGLLRNKV